MAEPAQFSGRAPGGGPRSALVAGILVVAFLALAVAKPWDHPLPPPAVSPSVTPSAAETLPAQPSATIAPAFPALVPFTLSAPPPRRAPWTVVRWQSLDPTSALAHLGTTLGWAGGYASVGDDGAGGTMLWTSPDGAAWTPIVSGTATTFWPGMHVEGVAAFGQQLLAVTSLPDKTALGDGSTAPSVVLTTWLSSDGAAWQLHGGPIFPNPTRLDGPVLVAGSGDRAIIAWNETPQVGGQTTGHVAVTDDGAGWRQVPASALPSGFEVMDAAAAPSSGFLVAGRTFADGVASASIVRSDATGNAWTPLRLARDPSIAFGEPASVVWQLSAAAAGVLAVGDSPGGGLWWHSKDGAHWTAVSGFAPVGSVPCSGPTPGCGASPAGFVVGNGDRMVAIGAPGPSSILRASASADGSQWQELRSSGSIPKGRPYTARLLPGGVVLIASDGAWYGEAASEP